MRPAPSLGQAVAPSRITGALPPTTTTAAVAAGTGEAATLESALVLRPIVMIFPRAARGRGHAKLASNPQFQFHNLKVQNSLFIIYNVCKSVQNSNSIPYSVCSVIAVDVHFAISLSPFLGPSFAHLLDAPLRMLEALSQAIDPTAAVEVPSEALVRRDGDNVEYDKGETDQEKTSACSLVYV